MARHFKWKLLKLHIIVSSCYFSCALSFICFARSYKRRGIYNNINRKCCDISCVLLFRYLQVVPNSSEDDTLLIELLRVLDVILSSPPQPPEPVVAWVARTVLQRDGPQMTLLRNVQTSTAGSETVSESKR